MEACNGRYRLLGPPTACFGELRDAAVVAPPSRPALKCRIEATSVAWMDAWRRATVATGSLAPRRRASESCATLRSSPKSRKACAVESKKNTASAAVAA